MSTAIQNSPTTNSTTYRVLIAISFCHFLNDTIQSLMLAIYPLFKSSFNLSFGQIGLITLTYQATASLLQPMVGWYTDRHPKPFSLSFGMACTLLGLLQLSMASSFPALLLAAAMVGSGSSIFHPESSRVARMASGGKHGLAQSIFQVGGNGGAAMGPLLAVWIVLPHGQGSIAWFSAVALLAIVVLTGIGFWYRDHHRQPKKAVAHVAAKLPRKTIILTLAVLLALIFSKFFYMASISNYLIFYLIQHYGVSTATAQYHLFCFLASVAAGTLLGGPIGDKIGRRKVIWVSILGVAPFTLALPYVGLHTSVVLSICIGFLLSSAFPAILVYAQELLPGKIGTISGLFFGLAFGLGGIGAAVLGQLADHWGIETVYRICAYLPLIGLLAILLPDIGRHAEARSVPTEPPRAAPASAGTSANGR